MKSNSPFLLELWTAICAFHHWEISATFLGNIGIIYLGNLHNILGEHWFIVAALLLPQIFWSISGWDLIWIIKDLIPSLKVLCCTMPGNNCKIDWPVKKLKTRWTVLEVNLYFWKIQQFLQFYWPSCKVCPFLQLVRRNWICKQDQHIFQRG